VGVPTNDVSVSVFNAHGREDHIGDMSLDDVVSWARSSSLLLTCMYGVASSTSASNCGAAQ
jgi:predicted protein tyrosine phosphatase